MTMDRPLPRHEEPPSPPGPRLQRLYPLPAGEVEAHGLYLDPEERHIRPVSAERPFVYANFSSSLDGRIALGAAEHESHVPAVLRTRVDWRLFQELQAHADCFITHGAYLRALAAGRLGDILQVGLGDDATDLHRWRAARGRAAQPSVIVASTSLDFELPPSVGEHGQRLVVVTTARAEAARVESLRRRQVDVRVLGDGADVSGSALVATAASLGCERVYLEAGPRVLREMLRQRLLGRLYLTLGHHIVGGEAFHSLVSGPPLGEHGRLQLGSLHYLAPGEGHSGQLFASYAPGADAAKE